MSYHPAPPREGTRTGRGSLAHRTDCKTPRGGGLSATVVVPTVRSPTARSVRRPPHTPTPRRRRSEERQRGWVATRGRRHARGRSHPSAPCAPARVGAGGVTRLVAGSGCVEHRQCFRPTKRLIKGGRVYSHRREGAGTPTRRHTEPRHVPHTPSRPRARRRHGQGRVRGDACRQMRANARSLLRQGEPRLSARCYSLVPARGHTRHLRPSPRAFCLATPRDAASLSATHALPLSFAHPDPHLSPEGDRREDGERESAGRGGGGEEGRAATRVTVVPSRTTAARLAPKCKLPTSLRHHPPKIALRVRAPVRVSGPMGSVRAGSPWVFWRTLRRSELRQGRGRLRRKFEKDCHRRGDGRGLPASSVCTTRWGGRHASALSAAGAHAVSAAVCVCGGACGRTRRGRSGTRSLPLFGRNSPDTQT